MRRDLSKWPVFVAIALVAYITVSFVILPNMPQSTTNLRIGDGVFRARIASNEADRAKGLSGVTAIQADQALLMVYPSDYRWEIWMKDMNVPIDIVWLDKNKKVIYIIKNAQPEGSTSRIFAPSTFARYVVELPAGTVDSKAIMIDKLAEFQIDNIEIK